GFLKTSHGELGGEPKKITLQRKTTTTLKLGSGSARKTVNVEVRKKRTYVKRDESDLQAVPDEAPLVEDVATQDIADVAPVEVNYPVNVAEPEVSLAAPESIDLQDSSTESDTGRSDGMEEKRRAAQERRMAEEVQRKN